ncbi:hypothetical protein B8W96_00945 [Lentilactobacillus parakefiri]|uniref:hypothetical protein n=1 Tax=Lentilactobacillus parakefiri TaxID=152332 RepID=UPI000BA68E0B|nr:hypothetical protein [Lentilactobacillus parakefiri]PAL01515.1 hypothetical protein B8W96_00945 [Lentilactobacillus parakefiri]
MAEYLKSQEEIRKVIHQAAEDLRPEDLIPYLEAAEDWEKNHRDEFDFVQNIDKPKETKLTK